MDTPLRAVLCVKNRDEMKKFEDKEDCFVLDFDPYEDLVSFSKLSVSDDLHVLAEKGKVACRDYPHPRHACAKFRFRTVPHESHCDLCYCYVCDYAAPCKKWVGKSRHCDAYENEKWGIKRKLWREALERKKEAYRGVLHPRYMCMEFPFENTPHNNHCELCYCYVCESAAPCGEWAGISSHCNAFNNENWRTKRELKRHPTKLQGKVQKEPGTDTDDLSEEAKVYVQNLSDTVTKHDLEMFFNRAGVVKKSEVVSVKSTLKSREIGFVTMSTVKEAEKAVAMFDGHLLHGMLLTVERCVPRRHPHPVSAETCSIYVGNLTRSVNDKRLEEVFRKHGYMVVEARVVVDRVTKRSYGYGLVKMYRECEREDAIKALNGQMVNGKAIKLVRVRDY